MTTRPSAPTATRHPRRTYERGRPLPPRWVLTAAVALVLTAALAGCADTSAPTPGPAASVSRAQDALEGTVLTPPLQMPDVTLTATDRRPFDLRADTDRPITLVLFGYTHCQDQCPLNTANVTLALRRLPPEVRHLVQPVFVTADPARDGPRRLRTWLDRYDDDLEGLTGPVSRIREISTALKMSWTPPAPGASGSYDVDHGMQVFAFDGDTGTSLALWSSPSPESLSHDLAVLARRSEA